MLLLVWPSDWSRLCTSVRCCLLLSSIFNMYTWTIVQQQSASVCACPGGLLVLLTRLFLQLLLNRHIYRLSWEFFMVTLLTVCFTFCSCGGVTSSSCSSLSDTLVPPHWKCMTFQLLDEQLKAGSVLSVDTHKNWILAKRFQSKCQK